MCHEYLQWRSFFQPFSFPVNYYIMNKLRASLYTQLLCCMYFVVWVVQEKLFLIFTEYSLGLCLFIILALFIIPIHYNKFVGKRNSHLFAFRSFVAFEWGKICAFWMGIRSERVASGGFFLMREEEEGWAPIVVEIIQFR